MAVDEGGGHVHKGAQLRQRRRHRQHLRCGLYDPWFGSPTFHTADDELTMGYQHQCNPSSAERPSQGLANSVAAIELQCFQAWSTWNTLTLQRIQTCQICICNGTAACLHLDKVYDIPLSGHLCCSNPRTGFVKHADTAACMTFRSIPAGGLSSIREACQSSHVVVVLQRLAHRGREAHRRRRVHNDADAA